MLLLFFFNLNTNCMPRLTAAPILRIILLPFYLFGTHLSFLENLKIINETAKLSEQVIN